MALEGGLLLLGFVLFWIWPLDKEAPSWSAQALFTIENGLLLFISVCAAWSVTSDTVRGHPWLRKIFIKLKETPLLEWAERAPAWHLLLISVAAGVGEEYLFRGFLQGHTGLIAASLIFGLCHFLTFGYFVFATLFGVFLGWFYQELDHAILPVILAHAAYDWLALQRIRWLARKENVLPPRASAP